MTCAPTAMFSLSFSDVLIMLRSAFRAGWSIFTISVWFFMNFSRVYLATVSPTKTFHIECLIVRQWCDERRHNAVEGSFQKICHDTKKCFCQVLSVVAGTGFPYIIIYV